MLFRSPHPQPQQPPPMPQLHQQRREQPSNFQRIRKNKKLPLSDRILNESKVPLIVALLFFILNLGVVDKQLIMRFARLVNDDTGDLNYIGIGVKAIVMGVLYYVVKKFV